MSSVFAKRGYAGNYVEKLQRKLNTVVVPELEPDGKFGSKTEAAVRSYQELMNLEPDGIVGVFTDAVLFGKAFDKLYRRPGFVEQANPKLCWAAATESWLTTRPERRNRSQQDIRAGLAAEGVVRDDGALFIPDGQFLWELHIGLRPVSRAPGEIYAEMASRLMARHGPLMIGYKPSEGSVGHVEVMWGTTIHAGMPAIVMMDPIRGWMVKPVPDIHGLSGRVVIWLPKIPLIL